MEHMSKDVHEREIAARLRSTFATVFKELPFDLDRSMSNTTEWTSLRHVQFLSGIEKQFGVEFEPVEVAQLTSVAAIVSFLANRVGAKG
jgi:acyl carrier protein